MKLIGFIHPKQYKTPTEEQLSLVKEKYKNLIGENNIEIELQKLSFQDIFSLQALIAPEASDTEFWDKDLVYFIPYYSIINNLFIKKG